jgi:hypothetical protein
MEVNGFLVASARVSALHGKAIGARAKMKGILRGVGVFATAFPGVERRRLERAAK